MIRRVAIASMIAAVLAGGCSIGADTETTASSTEPGSEGVEEGAGDDSAEFGTCRPDPNNETAFSPFWRLFFLDLAWFEVPVSVVGAEGDIPIEDNRPRSIVGRIEGSDAESFEQIAVTRSPLDDHEVRPTGTDSVESLILQLPTVEDLRVGTQPGDRVLIAAYVTSPDSKEWATGIALIERDEEVLVAGQCGNDELLFLQDFASRRGLSSAATVQLLLTDPNAIEEFDERINEILDSGSPPPTPWVELDPRNRQLGIGEEPPDVQARTDALTVEWHIPIAWRDLEGDICTWTDDGWGSCFSLAEGEGWETLDLVTYATQGGVLEYWLRLYDGSDYALGATSHQDLVDTDLIITTDRQVGSLVVRLNDSYEQTTDLLAALSSEAAGYEATVELAP